jgi:hypothetical protein
MYGAIDSNDVAEKDVRLSFSITTTCLKLAFGGAFSATLKDH